MFLTNYLNGEFNEWSCDTTNKLAISIFNEMQSLIIRDFIFPSCDANGHKVPLGCSEALNHSKNLTRKKSCNKYTATNKHL